MSTGENERQLESEELKQQILLEVENAKVKNPDKWFIGYLNNFFTHFPNRKFSEGSMSRWMSKTAKTEDIKPDDNKYSELKRSQTRREFDDTIESVMDELGIREQLAVLMEAYNKAPRRTDEQQQCLKALNEALVPVFIKLRTMGYSQIDLWT